MGVHAHDLLSNWKGTDIHHGCTRHHTASSCCSCWCRFRCSCWYCHWCCFVAAVVVTGSGDAVGVVLWMALLLPLLVSSLVLCSCCFFCCCYIVAVGTATCLAVPQFLGDEVQKCAFSAALTYYLAGNTPIQKIKEKTCLVNSNGIPLVNKNHIRMNTTIKQLLLYSRPRNIYNWLDAVNTVQCTL